jgi:excisionase family DNA binding protein
MITTAQAADLAHVSPERIRQLAAGGRLAATRGPRGTWLVAEDDVRAYAAERRTT